MLVQGARRQALMGALRREDAAVKAVKQLEAEMEGMRGLMKVGGLGCLLPHLRICLHVGGMCRDALRLSVWNPHQFLGAASECWRCPALAHCNHTAKVLAPPAR